MTDQNSNADAPRVGIAPDSWGVWNPSGDEQPSSEQYLREVGEAGYHWTELGPYGYIGTDHQQVADRVTEAGLSVSGGTVFTGLHHKSVDDVWAEVSDVAKLVVAVGAENLILLPEMWARDEHGHFGGTRAFSAEEWTRFLAGHNELGKRLLDEFGVKQQFHSHAESQIGSHRELVRLLEGTDEQFLNLCLDTGHYAYYWGETIDLMREFPNRIGYIHLKQVDPDLLADVLKNDISFVDAVAQGVMVEPPYGVPSYGPILEEAARLKPGMFAIIEQDMYPVGDFTKPIAIARRTREYIEKTGAPVRFR